MTLVARLAVVAFALVALAGCASQGDADLSRGVSQGGAHPTLAPVTTAVVQGPPPSAPSRPVCDLLAVADVAKAVGNGVRAGTGDPKFCFWGTAVDGGTSADVTIGIPAQGRGPQACAVQKLALPKEGGQEEAAVGTGSVWSYQQNGPLTQGALIACFDNAVIRVGMTGERSQAQLKQVAVALAEVARSRV